VPCSCSKDHDHAGAGVGVGSVGVPSWLVASCQLPIANANAKLPNENEQ
jgi:hypothetical protein